MSPEQARVFASSCVFARASGFQPYYSYGIIVSPTPVTMSDARTIFALISDSGEALSGFPYTAPLILQLLYVMVSTRRHHNITPAKNKVVDVHKQRGRSFCHALILTTGK